MPTTVREPETTQQTVSVTRRMASQTALDTLRVEEIVRTRTFLEIEMVLVGMVAPVTFLLGGDPVARALFCVASALLIVLNGGYLLKLRDDSWYTAVRMLPAAGVAIITAVAACWYFGLYSPAPMCFTLGVYFFSLGSSRLAAVATYVTCAISLGASMALLSLGVLDDVGLVHSVVANTTQQLVMTVLVEVVLLVTFVFGRMSRRASLAAVAGLEQALRQVGQREALLQEMNVDLERAMRVGEGRWSGQKVGPWRLANVIGRGAMGEIYVGTHEQKNLSAAVKLLVPDAQRDAAQIRRFLREAEVMSRLESPHVVRVHDVGTTGGGQPYIAMELLHGHDLAWHLRKRRRLPPLRVLELVKQVASVLEEARARDIVHRDLKPQNLFLADQEGDWRRLWKVLDFGVSKIGVEAGTLTRGHVIGTPGYMAPEQARGAAIDHRADVFGLAAIAYRAFTGRPAFAGDDYPKILFDIVYRQPTRPGEHAALPVEVDAVLAIGLAKDPDQRFASAGELAAALGASLEDSLAEPLRTRAETLLAAHPWGAAIR